MHVFACTQIRTQNHTGSPLRPGPLVQLHPRPGSNGEATEDHLCGARAPGGSVWPAISGAGVPNKAGWFISWKNRSRNG